MDTSHRDSLSEIEVRMRREAPKLPPNLRRRTLSACAAQAPPKAAPLRTRGISSKRIMILVFGLFVLHFFATNYLPQPDIITIGPDGHTSSQKDERGPIQIRTAELASFFSNLFK